MARPLRVEFPGAVYHVMARGNEQRPIFRDDRDRQRFLETLADAVAQFGLRLHAYCLMPNHHHLLLATPQANLSRAVGWLQTTYTLRFNARHHRRGHLFQGRFKAQLVEADAYARWLVEYIHLNPVRPRPKDAPIPLEQAGHLQTFPWSSHRVYAGLVKLPGDWLNLDWLRYWGRTRRQAHREYRAATSRALGKAVNNPWPQLRRGLVLGGEELLDRSAELLARKGGLDEARWTVIRETERLRARVNQLLASESDERLKVWARVRLGNERGADVGRASGYQSGSAVTMLMGRLEERARREKGLRIKMEKLREAVNCEE